MTHSCAPPPRNTSHLVPRMDQFRGPSEAARGNRRFAALAFGGLAIATYLMYVPAVNRDISKGATRTCSTACAAPVPRGSGADERLRLLVSGAAEIKSTADHVKGAVNEAKDDVAAVAKQQRR